MYSTLKAGAYLIHVGVIEEGSSTPTWIKDSPFSLQVAPEGSTDTVSSTAYGSGLQVAYAGEVAMFYIQAKDQHGNNRLVPEQIITTQQDVVRDESFRVVISFANTPNSVANIVEATPPAGEEWADAGCPNPELGESGINWKARNVITNCDLLNSTYEISYVATVSGNYDVRISRESAAGVEYIAKSEPTPEYPNGRNHGDNGFRLIVLPAPTNVTKTTTDLVDRL